MKMFALKSTNKGIILHLPGKGKCGVVRDIRISLPKSENLLSLEEINSLKGAEIVDLEIVYRSPYGLTNLQFWGFDLSQLSRATLTAIREHEAFQE